VIVNLGTATNVTLGTPATYTLTIKNDEPLGAQRGTFDRSAREFWSTSWAVFVYGCASSQRGSARNAARRWPADVIWFAAATA
jgi:hypothetical protein